MYHVSGDLLFRPDLTYVLRVFRIWRK